MSLKKHVKKGFRGRSAGTIQSTKQCESIDIRPCKHSVLVLQSHSSYKASWKHYIKPMPLPVHAVATSPVVLRWLCDSPRMGCAWRITPLYM